MYDIDTIRSLFAILISKHSSLRTIRQLTKVRAAPLVFFSPPSSKLGHIRQKWQPHRIIVRTACNASTSTASCTCTMCIPVAAQPSLSFSPGFTNHCERETSNVGGDTPSCGRQAWSVHRIRSAYGRTCAFPVRRATPCRSCTGSPYEA